MCGRFGDTDAVAAAAVSHVSLWTRREPGRAEGREDEGEKERRDRQLGGRRFSHHFTII